MRKLKTASFIAGLGWLAAIPAYAAWTETFDSYPVGNINGNGPWVDWGGALPPDVSTAQANSGPNSLALCP